MNNQEIFDKVWTWFIAERHVPGRNAMSCSYFIDPQTKCAIGCLLPDEIASKLDVRMCLTTIARTYLPEIEVAFLIELRAAHDTSAWNSNNFHDELERRLRELAAVYKLQTPETEEQMVVEKLLEEISEPVLT